MRNQRREYRPERVALLEGRALTTQILPFPQAIAVRFGTQMHPTVTVYKANSTRPTVYTQGGLPTKSLAFSTKLVRSPFPAVAAQEQSDPNLNTFKVSYRNGSKQNISWMSIAEKLDPSLRYVPGNEILPAGSKLNVTSDSNGVQTLTLSFPNGVPSGNEGYFAFQTKYRKPSF